MRDSGELAREYADGLAHVSSWLEVYEAYLAGYAQCRREYEAAESEIVRGFHEDLRNRQQGEQE